jgi:hypothetical protein
MLPKPWSLPVIPAQYTSLGTGGFIRADQASLPDSPWRRGARNFLNVASGRKTGNLDVKKKEFRLRGSLISISDIRKYHQGVECTAIRGSDVVQYVQPCCTYVQKEKVRTRTMYVQWDPQYS